MAVSFSLTTVTNTKTKSTLWMEGFLLSFRTSSIMEDSQDRNFLKYEHEESYLIAFNQGTPGLGRKQKSQRNTTCSLTHTGSSSVSFLIHSRIPCPGNSVTHSGLGPPTPIHQDNTLPPHPAPAPANPTQAVLHPQLRLSVRRL